MLLYFSATGNSRAVAERLARDTNDAVRPLLTSPSTIELAEGEALGLVCPVHGWGLPVAVRDALLRLRIKAHAETPYIYCVLTCGDDIGRTDREVRSLVKQHHGCQLAAVWSVTMPNTYVVLPGFDVDQPTVEQEKISVAALHLTSIATAIRERRTDIRDVHPGALPWTKSHVLGPLFRRFLVTDRIFSVDRSKCNACGRCANVCPLHHIRLDHDGRPQWGNTQSRCITCLACYHHCLHHAIQPGRYARGKGQYVFKDKRALAPPSDILC